MSGSRRLDVHPVSTSPEAQRFTTLFDRAPTEAELAAFVRARGSLLSGLPARARRRTARVIARL